MSSNKITFGWMMELKEPITDPVSNEVVREKLMQNGLGMNHEGTLIYMVTASDKIEEAFTFHKLEDDTEAALYDEAWALGVFPLRGTGRRFVDLWYDAADSNHDSITLDEWRQARGH